MYDNLECVLAPPDEQLSDFDMLKLRDAERQRDYRIRVKAATGNTIPISRTKPFCGIDGEGGTIGDSHEYLLLRAGEFVLETGDPLTVEDCLSFLCKLPKDRIWIGYYFDYDVTMMLRNMPRERLQRLLDRKARVVKHRQELGGIPLPIDWNGWQLDYLPGKEFKVRELGTKPWTIINDEGSFFQCKFVTALEKWDVGSEQQREEILRGKLQRAEFGELTEETRIYNQLEIELLEQLMNKFRAACIGIGYVPSKWQGPGQLAASMLRKHGIPKTKDLKKLPNIPAEVWDAANDSYIGGWFETALVGFSAGPVYQWDLNGAYPYAMTLLPCLIHGTWKRNPNTIPDNALYLAFGTFSAFEEAGLYGFPIRLQDGSILHPADGKGWYWSPEIRAAIHQSFDPETVWLYEQHCDCKPFDWMYDVYEERRKIGKTNKGIALKLAMNSCYGKIAQSVGSPPFANPIYASLITALTRAKLAEVIHYQDEEGDWWRDALMVATDGVFTKNNRPNLNVGKGLGQWDKVYLKDGMFIVQPGLYFTNQEALPKTRGIPQTKAIQYKDTFHDTWRRCVREKTMKHRVSIPVQSFVGLRLANQRNMRMAGQWDHDCMVPGCDEEQNHIHKKISFDWSRKRAIEAHTFGYTVYTIPQKGSPTLTSIPYHKVIGGDFERHDLWQIDTPDFVIPLAERQ